METAEREVKECSCNPEYIHTSTASCCASSAARRRPKRLVLGCENGPQTFANAAEEGPRGRAASHCIAFLPITKRFTSHFHNPGARARRGRKKPFRPTLKKALSPSGREKGGRPGVGVPSSLPPSFLYEPYICYSSLHRAAAASASAAARRGAASIYLSILPPAFGAKCYRAITGPSTSAYSQSVSQSRPRPPARARALLLPRTPFFTIFTLASLGR